jgi:hypothetical protein
MIFIKQKSVDYENILSYSSEKSIRLSKERPSIKRAAFRRFFALSGR